MGDAVAAVDDGAGQRPLSHLSGRPGGRQGENGLQQHSRWREGRQTAAPEQVRGYNSLHVLDGTVLTAAGIYHLWCIPELLGLVSLFNLSTTFPIYVLLFVLSPYLHLLSLTYISSLELLSLHIFF